MSARVAVIPGDGIGPEVIQRAVATVASEVDLVFLDAGAERYLSTGDVFTARDLQTIQGCDAVLLGAVGDPRVPDGVLERGILLRLRTELDLYINLRPFPEIGIAIVRENTEGLYAGIGERQPTRAFEVSLNTKSSIQRCARYAFDLAASRSGRLTLVHKSNVLTFAGGLWRDSVAEIAAEYVDVSLSYEHADAAAYHLVRDPRRYDVLLTDNLFGDLLSDVAAGVAGGLGKAASANLHPDAATRPSRCIGLFEPVHGSAPDIAGKGLADPTAAIRAVEMMTDTLTKEMTPT